MCMNHFAVHLKHSKSTMCCAQSLSCVQLFATPWTMACQALLSRGFSRQEYWSGLPCPAPGDLPTQGSNPGLPYCRCILLPSEPPGKPKNMGAGSLFLLQGIFPTQVLNTGLLHCRWILHKLSCQGSPSQLYFSIKKSIVFIYASDEHLKTEIKKAILYIID